jgi:hypothetical protein
VSHPSHLRLNGAVQDGAPRHVRERVAVEPALMVRELVLALDLHRPCACISMFEGGLCLCLYVDMGVYAHGLVSVDVPHLSYTCDLAGLATGSQQTSVPTRAPRDLNPSYLGCAACAPSARAH